MFFLNIPEDGQIDFTHGALYGYITMVIALSTIFFAVRQYRDNYNEGKIKFGKAFLIGLYITLTASVIYVVAWEIFYANYAPDFGEQYVRYLETQMIEEGLPEAEIATQLADHEGMMTSYKENTLMRLGMTFMEIFPVGLILSILSGLIFGVFFKSRQEGVATA